VRSTISPALLHDGALTALRAANLQAEVDQGAHHGDRSDRLTQVEDLFERHDELPIRKRRTPRIDQAGKSRAFCRPETQLLSEKGPKATFSN
jgi:hypothetical protein